MTVPVERPLLAALLVFGTLLSAAPQHSSEQRRIETLLAQMTLEEKFGQLQQLDGLAEGTDRPERIDLARSFSSLVRPAP